MNKNNSIKKQYFLCWLITLLIACNTTYKPNQAKSSAIQKTVIPSGTLINKQKEGIDFFAEGDKPSGWTLELDLEKGFSFKPSGNRIFLAPPVSSARNSSLSADIYDTHTDSGNLKVIVYDATCEQNNKNKNAPRKVEIYWNNKNFTGCATKIYDYLLNDIWVLEYIDNKPVDLLRYKKNLPTIEFNLAQNKLTGFNGCSNINGDFEVTGNHISFSPFAGNKIVCENNEAEKIFATLVSGRTVDYYIKLGILTLVLIDDSRLIFRKTD